jgi:hypothetical protein
LPNSGKEDGARFGIGEVIFQDVITCEKWRLSLDLPSFLLEIRATATGRHLPERERPVRRTVGNGGLWRDRAGWRIGWDYIAMERSTSQSGGNPAQLDGWRNDLFAAKSGPRE